MPTVYIIAGPNGAGKTTFATEFLPDFAECREFLNADLIATLYCPLSDSWMLFDNSQSQPRLIAREDAGGLYVAQTELYETIKKGAGGIRQ